MGRSTNVSAFDELLEKLADDDKSVVSGLAEKYPEFKEYGLRQSDYSRKMGELRDQVQYAQQWDSWKKENWVQDDQDPQGGYTQSEKVLREQLEAARREKEALQEQVAFGGLGDEMTFEQLEQSFDKIMTSKKIPTAEYLGQKEKELRNYVDNGIAPVMLTAQEIQLRHFKEFNEIIPAKDLLVKASEAGAGNFEQYWETSIAGPKRQAAKEQHYQQELKSQREELEARLEKQKQESEAERQRLIGMNLTANPSDAGDAQGNAFRQQMLGIDKAEEGKIPEVPVGEGGIAAHAAALYKKNGGHF